MESRCPKCSLPTPSGANACPNCGASLAVSQHQAEVFQATQALGLAPEAQGGSGQPSGDGEVGSVGATGATGATGAAPSAGGESAVFIGVSQASSLAMTRFTFPSLTATGRSNAKLASAAAV